jgi:hypothetical protein
MRTGKLFVIGCFAVIGVALMSCSKSDLYDSNAANQQKNEQQKKSYAELFVNNYGSTEGKSWDLATLATSYTLESSNRALTRDGEYNADAVEGEMLVEKATVDWMSENLKAGKNNTAKGKPFYLQVPKNSFTIVPIFQGTASYYWQLWMYVDGVGDKLIWSKGDIQYITSQSSTDWKSPGTGNTGMNNAYQIKAPTYEFKNLPENANMYFYLKVWNSYNDYKNQKINPRKLTSLNQMMLALINCQVPSNVPAGNEVSIIGCEDNVNGDFDYEDLVFMMYGNPAPPIKHVDEVIKGTPKRYMMEDLGEEHPDFDFNDVVVDVISGRAKWKREYEILENGGWNLINETKIEDLPDIAVVRAAGGILDFTLTIGNTTWTKSAKFPNYQQMLNTGRDGEIDYEKELDTFKVEGWNPTANNISVTVEGKAITFPETGKAPMVISVDPTTNWMFERTPAPESWFKK